MHVDDAHDDKWVAEKTTLHVHIRAQARAAQDIRTIAEPVVHVPLTIMSKTQQNLPSRHDPYMRSHTLQTK